jgi:hypothetical protein
VIEQNRARGSLEWNPVVLCDEQRLAGRTFGVPKETPSIVKVRMAGSRTVIGLIAGGVSVTPRRILADAKPASEAAALEPPFRSDQNTSWWWD